MGLWDSIKAAFFTAPKNKTPAIFIESAPGQPLWTTVSYSTLATEGYMQNVYVYAAVNIIARSVAGLNWTMYQYDEKGKMVELVDSPMLKLWNLPNPWMTQSKFLETVVSHLMVSGNSYIQCITAGSVPTELWLLRPDLMTIIAGDVKVPVAGYRYESGGYRREFMPEEILHLKLYNPLNDFYGLAPLQAGARAVDHNNASKAWNVALLQNSGRPSGAYISPSGLSPDEFARLQREINDKRIGAANAGKVPVLEGDLRWQEIAMKPRDADWLEGSKMSAREIGVAFGVPSELLGDIASKTFSNFQQGRKALYQDRVLPLADWIKEAFNRWLLPKFNLTNGWIDYDKDTIEALMEDRTELWTRINNSTFITQNEKRIALGYEEIEGGDVIYIPANITAQMTVAEAQVVPKETPGSTPITGVPAEKPKPTTTPTATSPTTTPAV